MDYNKEIDFSSLETFLDCPRKFMFRYVMNLVSTGPPSLDLVFGSCWHYGMELAFKQLQTDPNTPPETLTDIAREAFNRLWEAEAGPWFDPDSCFPKNPGRAADMFYRFFDEKLDTIFSHGDEIIGVEQPFTVDLNLGQESARYPAYIGKLDLIILKDQHSIEIIDHKTAKMVNDTTFNGFMQSMQTDGYLTAGHIYYDSLPVITYSVALCQKTKIDFSHLQISRRKAAIDRFLDDLLVFTTDIRNNLTVYKEEVSMTEDKLYNPRSFRRKPGYVCTKYFRKCPYFDLCLGRNNPMQWAHEPPQGFEFDEWHPANIDPNTILDQSQKEKSNV